jgi:hypothetical protein
VRREVRSGQLPDEAGCPVEDDVEGALTHVATLLRGTAQVFLDHEFPGVGRTLVPTSPSAPIGIVT